MIVYVANPLYDAVFKYLMEDERIAKTILSALLKKKVLEVNIRRNEYANVTRNEAISMFRIDFAAKVMDENGKSSLMLIELQKTWLSNTLHKRRYLYPQYNNSANQDSTCPIIDINILGHRIGDIETPLIYIKNKIAYDYEGREITKGFHESFIASFKRDCVIFQVPLLDNLKCDNIRQILSVFSQDCLAKHEKQLVLLDDSKYINNYEAFHIIYKLLAAASNPDMRTKMRLEEEYLSVLEEKDTQIMQLDQIIHERNTLITSKE